MCSIFAGRLLESVNAEGLRHAMVKSIRRQVSRTMASMRGIDTARSIDNNQVDGEAPG